MRVGIIDLGTNSIRLDIQDVPGSRPVRLYREKFMVRLGEGVFETGKLQNDAIQRTLAALEGFKITAKRFGVDRVLAFGTAALRDATNRDAFLRLAKRRSGFQFELLSGMDEARLIAKGVLSREKDLPFQKKKQVLALVDIGGGSTEVILVRDRQVLHAVSFPLGVARLQQTFIKGAPPASPESIAAMRKHIRALVHSTRIAEEWPKVDGILGSSGTILALNRVAQTGFPLHGDGLKTKKFKSGAPKTPKKRGGAHDRPTLERKHLKAIVQNLLPMRSSELLRVPGMEAKRLDLIVPGAVLLEELAECLKVREIATTEFSLRDGILQYVLDSEMLSETIHDRRTPSDDVRSTSADAPRAPRPVRTASATPASLQDLSLKECQAYVTQILAAKTSLLRHIQQVAWITDQLMRDLQPLHRLPHDWIHALRVSSWTHDLGQLLSPIHHGVHSAYWVENMPLKSLPLVTRTRAAWLNLHHSRGSKMDKKDLGFLSPKERPHALRALALLRIADSLDRGHRQVVKKIVVTVPKSRRAPITLSIAGKASLHLELLRLEQRRELFETVFERCLVANQM